jgi:hypothetical protein
MELPVYGQPYGLAVELIEQVPGRAPPGPRNPQAQVFARRKGRSMWLGLCNQLH